MLNPTRDVESEVSNDNFSGFNFHLPLTRTGALTALKATRCAGRELPGSESSLTRWLGRRGDAEVSPPLFCVLQSGVGAWSRHRFLCFGTPGCG